MIRRLFSALADFLRAGWRLAGHGVTRGGGERV